MSDLIRREDAINAVEMFFEDAYIEDAEVHDLVYKINHIPAASPWHRVEDGLPKKVGSYLTAYYDGFVCENQWHYIGPTAIGWVNDAEAVRYWMPLPEPPKEAQDANK